MKRYNSCRVLAFSIFFHSRRSWASSDHLVIHIYSAEYTVTPLQVLFEKHEQRKFKAFCNWWDYNFRKYPSLTARSTETARTSSWNKNTVVLKHRKCKAIQLATVTVELCYNVKRGTEHSVSFETTVVMTVLKKVTVTTWLVTQNLWRYTQSSA